MAIILEGSGTVTGITTFTTPLDDIKFDSIEVTGIATAATFQVGTGVSIGNPRLQNIALYTNDTEFVTVDNAGNVGFGTTNAQIAAQASNAKVINAGIVTANQYYGNQITAAGVRVTGVSTFAAVTGTTGTFSGAVSGTTGTFSAAVSGTTGTFSGDVDIADKIVHTGDTNTAIRFPSADAFTVETGGSELVRVNTTNVTIKNTASAWNKIQRAAATDYAGIAIQESDATQRMQFGVAGGTNQIVTGAAQYDVCLKAYDANLILATNSTEKVRITSAGRVGINETSPDTDLHIKNTNPAIYLEGTNGTGRQHKIWTAGTNSESLQFTSGNLLYNADVHYFRATNESTEYARITSTGHMGLGVVPSAWPTNADSTGLQIGTGFAAFGRGSGDEDRGGIAVNYYTDGSSNYYIGNGNANRIYMNDGNIDFQYAGTNSSNAGAALTFATSMRIDTSGNLLINGTSDSAPDGFDSLLQVNSANHTGSIVVGRHTANSNGPAFLFQKSRSGSATPGVAVLSSGDSLGVIRWYGSDGSDRNSSAAQIQCVVDGSPGGNDMPGKLIFNTTADGASSSTERMYINKNGQVLFAGTPGEGHGISASYGFYALGLATSGSETDTGISVNQGNAGATSLIFACRNTNNGTSTQSSLYFMHWYYDGNNAPAATKINGDNITFGVSGSNTLTVTGGAGNFRCAMIWIT